MKIALIRGPSLNAWEMQYYEPLAKKHQIFCIGSTGSDYDISPIKLPIIKLWCPAYTVGKLPGATTVLYTLLGDPRLLWNLGETLQGFDLAHSVELANYYTYQAVLAKKRGIVKKVVVTVSENIPFNHEKYSASRQLKNFTLAYIDHVLAISNMSKQTLLLEGIEPHKITVVPHGLDLTQFKFEPKSNINKISILSVGRLVWEKGFSEILLAARAIKNDRHLHNKQIEFVFAGDGPGRHELEALRRRLDLIDMVKFIGNVQYRKMPEIFHNADIFVLASKDTSFWREQFGMVLVEAMACGVPVVTTSAGAILETVAASAFMVKQNDWRGIYLAIKRLILDRKLYKKLARLGRKRVEVSFDRYKIAGVIDEVYTKIFKT